MFIALLPVRLLNLASPGGRGRVVDLRLTTGFLIPLAWALVVVLRRNAETPLLPDWARILAIPAATLALTLFILIPILVLVIAIPIWAMHLVFIFGDGRLRSGFLNFGTLDSADTDYLWRDDDTLIIAASDEYSWYLYRFELKGESGRAHFPWNLILGWHPRMHELTWVEDWPWIKAAMRACGMNRQDFERAWECEARPRDHHEQCRRFFSHYLAGAISYANKGGGRPEVLGFCRKNQLGLKDHQKYVQRLVEAMEAEGEARPASVGGVYREAARHEQG